MPANSYKPGKAADVEEKQLSFFAALFAPSPKIREHQSVASLLSNLASDVTPANWDSMFQSLVSLLPGKKHSTDDLVAVCKRIAQQVDKSAAGGDPIHPSRLVLLLWIVGTVKRLGPNLSEQPDVRDLWRELLNHFSAYRTDDAMKIVHHLQTPKLHADLKTIFNENFTALSSNGATYESSKAIELFCIWEFLSLPAAELYPAPLTVGTFCDKIKIRSFGNNDNSDARSQLASFLHLIFRPLLSFVARAPRELFKVFHAIVEAMLKMTAPEVTSPSHLGTWASFLLHELCKGQGQVLETRTNTPADARERARVTASLLCWNCHFITLCDPSFATYFQTFNNELCKTRDNNWDSIEGRQHQATLINAVEAVLWNRSEPSQAMPATEPWMKVCNQIIDNATFLQKGLTEPMWVEAAVIQAACALITQDPNEDVTRMHPQDLSGAACQLCLDCLSSEVFHQNSRAAAAQRVLESAITNAELMHHHSFYTWMLFLQQSEVMQTFLAPSRGSARLADRFDERRVSLLRQLLQACCSAQYYPNHNQGTPNAFVGLRELFALLIGDSGTVLQQILSLDDVMAVFAAINRLPRQDVAAQFLQAFALDYSLFGAQRAPGQYERNKPSVYEQIYFGPDAVKRQHPLFIALVDRLVDTLIPPPDAFTNDFPPPDAMGRDVVALRQFYDEINQAIVAFGPNRTSSLAFVLLSRSFAKHSVLIRAKETLIIERPLAHFGDVYQLLRGSTEAGVVGHTCFSYLNNVVSGSFSISELQRIAAANIVPSVERIALTLTNGMGGPNPRLRNFLESAQKTFYDSVKLLEWCLPSLQILWKWNVMYPDPDGNMVPIGDLSTIVESTLHERQSRKLIELSQLSESVRELVFSVSLSTDALRRLTADTGASSTINVFEHVIAKGFADVQSRRKNGFQSEGLTLREMDELVKSSLAIIARCFSPNAEVRDVLPICNLLIHKMEDIDEQVSVLTTYAEEFHLQCTQGCRCPDFVVALRARGGRGNIRDLCKLLALRKDVESMIATMNFTVTQHGHLATDAGLIRLRNKVLVELSDDSLNQLRVDVIRNEFEDLLEDSLCNMIKPLGSSQQHRITLFRTLRESSNLFIFLRDKLLENRANFESKMEYFQAQMTGSEDKDIAIPLLAQLRSAYNVVEPLLRDYDSLQQFITVFSSLTELSTPDAARRSATAVSNIVGSMPVFEKLYNDVMLSATESAKKRMEHICTEEAKIRFSFFDELRSRRGAKGDKSQQDADPSDSSSVGVGWSYIGAHSAIAQEGTLSVSYEDEMKSPEHKDPMRVKRELREPELKQLLETLAFVPPVKQEVDEKHGGVESEEDTSVSKYVEVLRGLGELFAVAKSLRLAGHPAFRPSQLLEITFSGSEIAARVKTLLPEWKQALEEWRSVLTLRREESISLKFFGVLQLMNLHGSILQGEPEQKASSVRLAVSLICPNACKPESLTDAAVGDLVRKITPPPSAIQTDLAATQVQGTSIKLKEAKDSLSSWLNRLGGELNELTKVAEKAKADSPNPELAPKQFLLKLRSQDFNECHVLRAVIGQYSKRRLGRPHRSQVLFCSEQTTAEELRLFLELPRCIKGQLFTIVHFDRLPQVLHSLLLQFQSQILEANSNTGHENAVGRRGRAAGPPPRPLLSPVLFVCNSDAKEAILLKVSQISELECKSNTEFDPDDCKEQCPRFSSIETLCIVVGRSGDGKTHYIKRNIRAAITAAGAPKFSHHRIAIDEASTLHSIVTELTAAKAAKRFFVHFDISAYAPKRLAHQIFCELLLFGSTIDSSTGQMFSLELAAGQAWHFWVEIPSHWPTDPFKDPASDRIFFTPDGNIDKLLTAAAPRNPLTEEGSSAFWENYLSVQIPLPVLWIYNTAIQVMSERDQFDIQREWLDEEKTKLSAHHRIGRYLQALGLGNDDPERVRAFRERPAFIKEDKAEINMLYSDGRRDGITSLSFTPCASDEVVRNLFVTFMRASAEARRVDFTRKSIMAAWVRFMARRIKFLETCPAIAFDQGLRKNDRHKVTRGYRAHVVRQFLLDAGYFCDLSNRGVVEENKASRMQVVYDSGFGNDGDGSIAMFTLDPQHLGAVEKDWTQTYDLTINSVHDLEKEIFLQEKISWALGVPMRAVTRIIQQHAYILTPEYLVQLLHIHEMSKCGVPIIIEGGTGVGKTYTVHLYSKLLNCAERLMLRYMDEFLRFFARPATEGPGPRLALTRDAMTEQAFRQCVEPYVHSAEAEANHEAMEFRAQLHTFLVALHAQYQPYLVVSPEVRKLLKLDASRWTTDNYIAAIRSFFEQKTLSLFVNIGVHESLTADELNSVLRKYIRKARALKKACKKQNKTAPTMIFFFDEVNTSPSLSAFKRVMIDRVFEGKPIPSNVFFVAAINPNKSATDIEAKDRQNLFAVRDLPQSMALLTWKFGSLKGHQLEYYVNCMFSGIASKHAIAIHPNQMGLLSQLLVKAHAHSEHYSYGASISQRDIQRCFLLFRSCASTN